VREAAAGDAAGGVAGALGARFQRDVAWNIAPLVLLAVTGIALNVWIGHEYGAAALGVFNSVYAVYIFFSMAAAGGINYSVLRAVAAHTEDREKVSAIVTGALAPTILLSALVSLAFYAARVPIAESWDKPGVAAGMAVATPGLFCFAVNKLLLGVVNGFRRMRAFAVFQGLRYLLILAGLFLCHSRGWSSDRLSFVWTFSEGLLLLALAVEVAFLVAWNRCRGWMDWSFEHLRYGAKSVLSTMMLELNAKVDIWMLSSMLDSAAVGVYALAANVAEGVFQLVIVLQNNFNPLLARQIASGRLDELETMVRRSRRWIVPGMVGIGALAALVFPWTLPVLTDPVQFGGSALSFAILIFGIVAASAYLPFGNTLLMAGQPGWHTAYMAASVLVNVVFNALLIPRYGIHGAAAGTAISFVASAVFLKVLVRMRVGARI
jgi:O-antigen/teichoic acid export membrane protein